MTKTRGFCLLVAVAIMAVSELTAGDRDEKYKTILFVDSGRVDVHYVTGTAENYIYISGPNKSLTIRYPLGGAAPSLSWTLSGLEVVAGQGRSLVFDECEPDLHLYCFGGGIPGAPLVCSCIANGGWCDTADEGPVYHTQDLGYAGCGD